MLRIMYRRRVRNLPKSYGRGPGPEHGPQGRINRMREMVTSLVRHERIEGITDYVDETRGYAERVWDALMTSKSVCFFLSYQCGDDFAVFFCNSITIYGVSSVDVLFLLVSYVISREPAQLELQNVCSQELTLLRAKVFHMELSLEMNASEMLL